jgi:addiction module HigA family antidote
MKKSFGAKTLVFPTPVWHGPPTHPGEMLLEEFLKPMDLSQTKLAEKMGVSYPRVNELIHGKRGVTPGVLYLAKFSEGIYVLHAFQKRSRATSASDIDLATRRLKQLVRERGSHRDQP